MVARRGSRAASRQLGGDDPILLFMSMIMLRECQCAIIDFYCSIERKDCIITRNFDFYNKMGLESVYWFYDGDFIPSTFSAFVYKRTT